MHYCYTDVALASRDTTVCDSHKLSSYQQAYCYSKVAKLKKDQNLCQNISSSKHIDYCYAEVAIVTDTDFCEKIAKNQTHGMFGSNLKELCISNREYALSGDLKYCEPRDYKTIFGRSFYPAIRNECILNSALARNDVTLCKEIDDSFNRSVCINALE
jgi:hypothetical protein